MSVTIDGLTLSQIWIKMKVMENVRSTYSFFLISFRISTGVRNMFLHIILKNNINKFYFFKTRIIPQKASWHNTVNDGVGDNDYDEDGEDHITNDESELSCGRVEQFGIFSSISPAQPPHYSTLHPNKQKTKVPKSPIITPFRGWIYFYGFAFLFYDYFWQNFPLFLYLHIACIY